MAQQRAQRPRKCKRDTSRIRARVQGRLTLAEGTGEAVRLEALWKPKVADVGALPRTTKEWGWNSKVAEPYLEPESHQRATRCSGRMGAAGAGRDRE